MILLQNNTTGKAFSQFAIDFTGNYYLKMISSTGIERAEIIMTPEELNELYKVIGKAMIKNELYKEKP